MAKAIARKSASKTSTTSTAKVSPLAPASFPRMEEIRGVEIATASTGEKYKGRKDLLIVRLAPGTSAAGALTQSATASAAVDWCRAGLSKKLPKARALLVNAGNANAFTGKAGRDSVQDIVSAMAEEIGCQRSKIYVASTGVIGEPLNTKKIRAKLGKKVRSSGSGRWQEAAEAICTTDTYPKGSYRTALIDGVEVRIGGIAKGSGMIAPDMATMLSFIFTDAKLSAPLLQALITVGIRDSFNSITVDSDTSTSDTVLFFATGKSNPHTTITRAGDARLRDFRDKLQDVLVDLAHQVVRDGEGATKFVSVRVAGAKTARSARKIALAIANSPLVKTAIAGQDANWGRVVMAVGKAGEPADRDKIEISFGPHLVAEQGQRAKGYDEAVLSRYMKQEEIEILVDLNLGLGRAQVWTCDLTHGYISINADYRS